MNAVVEIAAVWLKRTIALLRSVGPYAAIEILLPGGTLIALLLWLSRQGAFTTDICKNNWIVGRSEASLLDHEVRAFQVAVAGSRVRLRECGGS